MQRCFSCMSFGAGKRLVLEKALPKYRGPGRPISVSAVPYGPGIGLPPSQGRLLRWAFLMLFGTLPLRYYANVQRGGVCISKLRF